MKSTWEGHSVTPLPLFLFMFMFMFFFFLGACPPVCCGSIKEAVVMAASGGCGGRSVGACLLERGMGVAMGSEVSRRLLQQSQNQRYISYRSLKGDAVPCATPGASYYSCHALPRANPHTRGCLAITHCARESYP